MTGSAFEWICEIEAPTKPDMMHVRHQIGVLSKVASAYLIPDNHVGHATVSSIAVAHEVDRMGGRSIARHPRTQRLRPLRRLADPDDHRRVLVDVTPAAQSVLDHMLPEVQQMANTVMSALDDKALHALLETLAAVGASVDNVPDDLPPRRHAADPPASAVPTGSGTCATFSAAWCRGALVVGSPS